ncbi:MAG: hypothetical protein CVV00_14925 [Firmicutes bacterium HGW-Firmicutes-5]|nr:MAG: hypothetical protein CVV00_14925 [Firmicutes bacterium HGW-Firmicutes-5]
MAAHQTKLNVIGNNIANVNTYGFKASRVVFSDVLYQNLSTATGATATTGGTNASQLGYGAKVGSIDMLNTISSGATTGRALDVYIAGEGYLTVQPEAGTNRYTRVGNLKFDADGNLTDGGGSKVMGIPLDADGNPVLNPNGTLPIADLQAINVPPAELEKYTGITIGKSGEITGIRAGDPEFTKASGIGWLNSLTVPTDSNYTGSVQIAVGDMLLIDSGSTELNALSIEPTADVLGTLTLKKTGDVYTLDPAGLTLKDGTTPITADLTGTLSSNGILTFANLPGLRIDTTKLISTDTDLESGVDIGSFGQDGYVSVVATVKNQGGVTEFLKTADGFTFDPAATSVALTNTLTGGTLTLGVDGAQFDAIINTDTVLANTTVGKIETGSDKPVTLGYLALSKFANVDGLLQDGNGYFMESANSGTPIASKAGGFQANSRIITVSDSILEELINLKR